MKFISCIIKHSFIDSNCNGLHMILFWCWITMIKGLLMRHFEKHHISNLFTFYFVLKLRLRNNPHNKYCVHTSKLGHMQFPIRTNMNILAFDVAYLNWNKRVQLVLGIDLAVCTWHNGSLLLCGRRIYVEYFHGFELNFVWPAVQMGKPKFESHETKLPLVKCEFAFSVWKVSIQRKSVWSFERFGSTLNNVTQVWFSANV